MSTATATVISTRAGEGRVTLPRVVNSEWIKFRSLRSSYWTLAATVVLTIGFGALFCWATVNRWDHLPPDERAHFTPVEHSLRGYFLAQMAIGVLGVLVVTGEYSTGMIRASLSAVPRRLPVLWAKTAVFGAITWVVATVSCVVAFFLGQAILAGKHLDTTISAPGVTRVVLGMGLYLTAVGLLAVGIGTLIRNTAGGIAAVFGTLLVLPLLAEALPSSWQDNIVPYLPGNAGQALATLHQGPHDLAPWTGFGVLCLYVVAALIGAAVVLKRRDA
ncbi:ABC transporter permease subunit [Kitasatospora sp. GP82]|uniref:ABC transporter permease subunit n=1 Tax=Kitasatospora sp. GP82 TaxID=3035089 RepID=UPI002475CA32|nr:ABC transporter permease subunit [Kitasatospora sp. GP82]MDH6124017.1 ABC-2 type transport system permease protein [Kitasatospora sp. GP82]